MRVPRGVLFHDPVRWRLFLAPADLPAPKLRAFLDQNGLHESSPEPLRPAPRLRQIFWVRMDQLPSKALRTRPGARFSCACCGASCSTMKLGPILPADAQRLAGAGWTDRDPATFFVDGDDQPMNLADTHRQIFLRRNGERCQFLRDDNLCEVHARFGARTKPLMCRMFPYVFRATPTAVTVAMRLGECASAPAASKGLPLAEQHPDLAQMLAEHDAIGFVPPTVWATPSRLMAYEEYERIEAELVTGTGDFAAAVFRAFDGEARPAAGFAVLADRAGLAGRAAQTLSAEARALEDQFCRAVVFSKELFLHRDLAQAAALLLVRRALARLEASDGSPEALNDAWKSGADRALRDMVRDLDLRGIGASLAAAG